MAGDEVTGITIMQMDAGLDTGDMLLVEQIPITPETTAGGLHDDLAQLGATLISRALSALSRDALVPTAQNDADATYANKIEKSEGRLDWSRPAHELDCQIRGLSPSPGAWFELDGESKPRRIKVLRAHLVDGSGAPGTVLDEALTVACGSGALALDTLQREGKKAMSAEEFRRGLSLPAGLKLA